MPKRKYKVYLEPHCSLEIPRSTHRRICHQNEYEMPADETRDGVTLADETPTFEIPADGNHCGVKGDHESLPHEDEARILADHQGVFMQENTLPEDAESSDSSNFQREDSESPDDSNFECSNDPPGNGADTDMDTSLKATGKTSRAEALLMILTYAARHQITGSALDDLLKLINHLFGQDVVPASKYASNKVFQRNMDKVEFILYCKDCKTSLGGQNEVLARAITVCSACNSPVDPTTLNNGAFFISVPIAPQIQNILHTPELQTKLSYRVDRPAKAGNIISDIYDGDLYKVLSAPGEILSDPNNLSYTFNSDGSPLYKSSRFSIWPIHLHLNELPPNIRFKHVILAGLWFGSTEPQMHVFLKPFVDQAKALATKAVSWKKDEGVVISKVVGLCCCVDSKARPAMQNCTQFNGHFGCGFCLHPGTLVNRQVKYPITESDYPDRDAESMLKDMEEALNLKKNVRGVKGPSPLINMPFFDIVWGFAPDYMHAVLLGVARQHAMLLLESVDEPYYIGNPTIYLLLQEEVSFEEVNKADEMLCMFKINPDKGSKVERQEKKKSVAVNPKVLSLINRIAEFEWST
ncbi:uncharacterized protein LOC121635090 [Melanotaenia boesemani]|uniref:uncharacterized protein LOC121635090 n=1 Tax=Melanotaenia boesemani TaxID=1250792 RepID=UPI001C044A6F|nr:uncharacterized protein LOC121635090 [Melanotaenia boesemani]